MFVDIGVFVGVFVSNILCSLICSHNPSKDNESVLASCTSGQNKERRRTGGNIKMQLGPPDLQPSYLCLYGLFQSTSSRTQSSGLILAQYLQEKQPVALV